jgi:tRNA(Ile2) C34 agmatinyltransferase TiaS
MSAEGTYAEEDAPCCPACGGPLVPLGQLGRRRWFRCRDCGIDCSDFGPDSTVEEA